MRRLDNGHTVEGGKAMVESSKRFEYAMTDNGVRIERCVARAQDIVMPEFICDAPVTAIAPYAFEGNADIRSVVCSPQVTEMGSRAFANCPVLERIVFPTSLARYDNSWVAGCARLREIVLPGAIVDLALVAPAPMGVKRVVVGGATQTVKIAPAWKMRLEEMAVHPENKWLSSDGICIYSADGTELITHATKASEVSISKGCARVASHAFELEKHLERVNYPEGVLEVGERAFAESSLLSFESPRSMCGICREAFAGCQSLQCVELNDGLVEIDERAFAECSACAGVRIPASVVHVGRRAFEGTGLQPSGENPTLTVSSLNPVLFIDESGVLCKRDADGIVVLEALDDKIEHYRTPDGAVRVAKRAFFGHPHLEQLEIAEGVTEVGREAFMRCGRLRSATLPSSLRRLEARAFATTALTSCTLPAAVEHLGECAFAFNFKNWHPTTNPPVSRAHIALEPGNKRYFVKQGLLYERCEGGGMQVVLYVGPDIDLDVPQYVRSIEPYAFFGVQGIRELRLPMHMPIGEATFAMRKPPDRIVLLGDDGIEFETMRDWRGVCALQRAFAGDGTTTAQLLCTTFDEEALGARPDYEVYRYMVKRLVCPVHLESSTRETFYRRVKERLEDVCVEFARHDDRARIDELANLGLISEENIDQVIESVSAADSAPIMAHLYELKRTRFSDAARDYGL